uniref:Uncharacterized protein n=1 Tax=Klebsiella phage vB_Kpn2-P2 TaxID=3230849 RepID=A0AAU8EEQ2_9VIRU
MSIPSLVTALKSADWSSVSTEDKALIWAAILKLEEAEKDGNYRARATKAEQENADLRNKIAHPPYKGLQTTVTQMLKLPANAPLNEIANTLKWLRDNKDLYEAGREARALTAKERQEILDIGVAAGKQIVIDKLLNLQRKGEL